MQGNGGFTRSRYPLDDHRSGLLVSDNLILLFLDRRDNGFHLFIGGMAQLTLQHIILDIDRAFESILHFSIFDFKLPLSGQTAFDFT